MAKYLFEIEIYTEEPNHENTITFRKETMEKVMNDLNGTALKLYLWLSLQKYGTLTFYPKKFCELAGGSMTGEKNAFQELREKGYLIETGEGEFTFSQKRKF